MKLYSAGVIALVFLIWRAFDSVQENAILHSSTADVICECNNPGNLKSGENGFTCSCPAFRKCKHIRNVEEKFDAGPDCNDEA